MFKIIFKKKFGEKMKEQKMFKIVFFSSLAHFINAQLRKWAREARSSGGQ